MSLSFNSHDWAKLPEMPALPAHLQACEVQMIILVNSRTLLDLVFAKSLLW